MRSYPPAPHSLSLYCYYYYLGKMLAAVERGCKKGFHFLRMKAACLVWIRYGSGLQVTELAIWLVLSGRKRVARITRQQQGRDCWSKMAGRNGALRIGPQLRHHWFYLPASTVIPVRSSAWGSLSFGCEKWCYSLWLSLLPPLVEWRKLKTKRKEKLGDDASGRLW